MKKLMILGGSNCQLHALQGAKERGIGTVLIDYTAAPPGKELADRHLPVSTFDAAGCIRAAKETKVDGVLAVGTDQPVLTAARVAAACGLPFALTVEQALAVTNKRRMKAVYRAHDIPTPAYLYLTKDGRFLNAEGEETALSLHAPFVIKPLDSQGQRGVYKAQSEAELRRFLPETLSFSAEDVCLVEEYIESDEITVSGWVRDGAFCPLTITDRIHHPDEVHIGVCTGHRYPSVHIRQKAEITTLCERVTAAFTLTEGPFYFQILRARDGSLFANEIACRIGGAFEDVTIPRLTGFDILDAAIDLAIGETSVAEKLPPQNRCHDETVSERCFVPLLFCNPGTIREITPLHTLRALPGVADCAYNFQAGDVIPVMQNATARFGHAVIFGEADSMERNLRTVLETLRVTGEDGTDLLLRDVIPA